MKFILLLLMITCTVVNCKSIYDGIINQLMLPQWSIFKMKYNKYYNSSEEPLRKKIFLDNKMKIDKHNKKFLNGETSFFLEMNRFGDLLNYEYKKMNGYNGKRDVNYLSFISQTKETVEYESQNLKFLEPANVKLPDEVDWRKKGAVTPVKDQRDCGSCWAFSATGSLEGQHFRHNGTLLSLSEQNLIDCSKNYGNDGCNGGLMNNAFNYVRYNHGIDTEKSYPYEAEDDKCRYNPRNSGTDDDGYVNIPKGDEFKLQAAVATIGPISVAIDAGSESFQFYKGGIYYEPECSSENLDHAVLAVGYGIDSKSQKAFWLVKNSYGTDWGERGYIRMSRNRHNNCGIATAASYPLVK